MKIIYSYGIPKTTDMFNGIFISLFQLIGTERRNKQFINFYMINITHSIFH